MNISYNIYDVLMMVDNDGVLQPALAVSAEPVEDTVWEIELREGVTFHNGDPFDADVVKWNWERITNPDTGASYMGGYVASIEDIEIVDSHNLKIITSAPDPTLMMALQFMPMGSPKYFEEVGEEEYGAHPVGTGPFEFVSWTPDEQIELRAYDDHWRGRPKVDRLIFRTIPDHASLVAALRTQEVDLMTNLSPDLVPGIEGDPNLKVLQRDSNRSIMTILDTTQPPFDDVRVRQAINYATDVPALIDNVLAGYGNQLPSMLAPMYVGFNEELEPFSHDIERAKELLAEAGYPDGVSFEMQAPQGRYVKDADIAQALVAQWAEAGLRADLSVMEWTSFVQLFSASDLSTYLIGYGAPIFDSGRAFLAYTGCKSTASNYCNPETEDLLTEGLATIDEDERAEIYREINEIWHEDPPFVFMYQQVDLYGANANLTWSPRPDERVWLFDADISPDGG